VSYLKSDAGGGDKGRYRGGAKGYKMRIKPATWFCVGIALGGVWLGYVAGQTTAYCESLTNLYAFCGTGLHDDVGTDLGTVLVIIAVIGGLPFILLSGIWVTAKAYNRRLTSN
jgi:hypothetical protein